MKTVYVEFTSGFPDDGVEDDRDILVQPGRNVMESLCGNLGCLGVATDLPQEWESYCWISAFTFRRVYFELAVQKLNLWFLRISAYPPLFALPATRKKSIGDGMEIIKQAVAKEPRIINPRWLSERDFDLLRHDEG